MYVKLFIFPKISLFKMRKLKGKKYFKKLFLKPFPVAPSSLTCTCYCVHTATTIRLYITGIMYTPLPKFLYGRQRLKMKTNLPFCLSAVHSITTNQFCMEWLQHSPFWLVFVTYIFVTFWNCIIFNFETKDLYYVV